MARQPFEIGGISVRPGRRAEVELPIARLATGPQVSLPVLVVHGKNDGPTIWLSAAIHGDEINGVEIIRRVLERVTTLSGTILAVPVVNVFGFVNGSRYLPDRRDLNRSFPGSSRGSLASQIASLLMTEVVGRSTVGIDLHTGSDHRTNLPQIRADLDDERTHRLAAAFDAPIMLHASIRDGSLRQAATEVGAAVLLYEAGEARRFDERAIRTGVAGIMRVLVELEMIDGDDPGSQAALTSRSSRWVRARRAGIAHFDIDLGDRVTQGQSLGAVHNSFGRRLSRFSSPTDGIVIGMNLDPLVNRGDAMLHIAVIENGVPAAPTEPTPTDPAATADQTKGPSS